MEILIYTSILAIVSIVVINSYIITIGSFNQTRSSRDLLESGNLSMERISREIRQAGSVDIANSTLNSTPGILKLNGIDSSNNAYTIKFQVVGSALNIYQNDVLIGNLVGSNISITNLIFRKITTEGTKEAVKIEMTLQDDRSQSLRNENFYDTVILRGGY